MKIEFVDLKAQYLTIKEEIDSAIDRVLNNTSFIGGTEVNSFASEFEQLYGVKHCIPVANGTDAIYISLKMQGIGVGDEVITTSASWISTSETITQCGATPVFVDVDDFYTLDSLKIKDKITSRTKAIIPVHLYGQMCDMEAVMKIAKEYNLLVIEDCAQSHFSELEGVRAGLWGNCGTFSFYPGKNLGAYGDAGCIITNDSELARMFKMYSNHGALVKHEHEIEGINSRLDGLQAAILRVKLNYILNWTNRRVQVAHIYNEGLASVLGIEIPKVRPNSIHSYHLYVVKVKEGTSRDELQEYLLSKGIATAIHYPVALPNMKAYEYLGFKEQDYPISTQNQEAILSLPIYPELKIEDQEYIIESIKSFFA